MKTTNSDNWQGTGDKKRRADGSCHGSRVAGHGSPLNLSHLTPALSPLGAERENHPQPNPEGASRGWRPIRNRQSAIANGFTLIELLTVIGIMAALAALLLPVASVVKKHQYIYNTQAEMAKLETAIDRYKAAYGFYPPDNHLPSPSPPNPPSVLVNQLYYELVGTTFDPTNNLYKTLDGSAQIHASDVQNAFGVGGFMNCSKPNGGEEASVAKNFLPDLRPNQVWRGWTNSNKVSVDLLVGAVGGPDAGYKPMNGTPGLNPWRYNSSNPTNNPGAYDLWIQLSISGQTNLICNWSKQVQVRSPLP